MNKNRHLRVSYEGDAVEWIATTDMTIFRRSTNVFMSLLFSWKSSEIGFLYSKRHEVLKRERLRQELSFIRSLYTNYV